MRSTRSFAFAAALVCHCMFEGAVQLNRRPRKQLGYHTPEECYGR